MLIVGICPTKIPLAPAPAAEEVKLQSGGLPDNKHENNDTKQKANSMKTNSKNMAPWMAALLCLAVAPGAKATDDADAPKAASSHETSSEMKSTEGTPAKCNKASGFIGMDVRNQDDEHLGHIKDLVFDLKTERVSYAVISTAPKALLGIDEKLLAVPVNALMPGTDGKYLILNADKSKVQAAAGFDRDNWPSLNNPSWGAEPFWQKDTEKSGIQEKPAKQPDATSDPEVKPDSKSDSDPEAKPDSDSESKSKSDSESDSK